MLALGLLSKSRQVKGTDKRFQRKVPTRRDLIHVVVTRRERVLRAEGQHFGDKSKIVKVNGTAESIVEKGIWMMDKEQLSRY